MSSLPHSISTVHSEIVHAPSTELATRTGIWAILLTLKVASIAAGQSPTEVRRGLSDDCAQRRDGSAVRPPWRGHRSYQRAAVRRTGDQSGGVELIRYGRTENIKMTLDRLPRLATSAKVCRSRDTS